MNVLLLYIATENVNMPVLPLGLAMVAAAAEQEGHTTLILNLSDQTDFLKNLARAIVEFCPDAIGFCVRNVDDQCMKTPLFLLPPVKKAVSICKQTCSAPVVLGGAGFSMFPESALAYLGADAGVCGEGEDAFCRVLSMIQEGIRPVGQDRILYSRRFAGQRNLDRFPLPEPQKHLVSPSWLKREDVWLPVQSRRGCAMGCSYCSTPAIEGTVLKKRSPKQVAANMAQYVEAGFSKFFFVDNTFNLPVSYALELCDEILGAGLNIEWKCIIYPGRTNMRLAEKMARAGCTEVSLGFESGSMPILRSMNKRFSPDDVRCDVLNFRRAGIRQMGFLLLGGPGETRETVEQSLDFADSLALEVTKVTQGIRIYPDTQLHKTAKEQGLILAQDSLLFPRFYLAKPLVGWVEDVVRKRALNNSGWII